MKDVFQACVILSVNWENIGEKKSYIVFLA